MSEVVTKIVGGVGILQWHAPKRTNFIGKRLEGMIREQLLSLDRDPRVKTVVLTGGEDRSFGAGGDFNEMLALNGPGNGDKVDDLIDMVIGLYTTILEMRALTVAAIDHHCIGLGFQIALSCDLRIATKRARFIMPELRNGIACTIGQYMLSRSLSRVQMQNVVYGCDPITGEQAAAIGLVRDLIGENDLVGTALQYASRFVEYAEVPLQNTKRVINTEYIEGLRAVAVVSKAAHREGFAASAGLKHFRRILHIEPGQAQPADAAGPEGRHDGA